MKDRLKTARTVWTAVIGAIVLNFPLLGLADDDDRILGIPVLFAYVFWVWAIVVALIALAVHLSR